MEQSVTGSGVIGAEAFLIVQRGAARLEVVPMEPSARVSVGRASSNRLVLADPKCSREHCEFFHRDGKWFVRDLDSRNGLTVDGRRVNEEHALSIGETVGIGACSLLYTDREPHDPAAVATIQSAGQFAVIERKSGTKFDALRTGGRVLQHGQYGVSELFQLAQAMIAAQDVAALADCVLSGLQRGTGASAAAVLLFPPDAGDQSAEFLEPAAVRGPDGSQVSSYLSELVLHDREAVLVHDIPGHEVLSARQSLSGRSLHSAICAPIRSDSRILGIIHLYAADAAEPLDSNQLEFTLAVGDQMAGHLLRLQDRQQLEADISRFEGVSRELQRQLEIETELIGQSEPLNKVRRAIARVAPTHATVLIRGESGVGKELVARGVHYNSERRGGPFVCVNCAALTESLLESELFGHEKGAFTGAAGQKAGKFEQSDGGTLFLDEIGEMHPDLQAKFLRVLEGQPFERVGGGKPITVDVRVVTATNRNLEQAVRAGKFRSDLYFRLQVIEISIPPLREHPEDIVLIAHHFLQRFARKARVRVRGFSREALDILQRHHWPGNVRELRNVVERAVILADHDLLLPQDITLSHVEVARSSDTPRPAEPPADRPTEPGPVGERGLHAEFDVPSALERILQEELTLDELDE
ncbi:MAG: sigma 54-interacting transcriptional regulator, partial [Pirellulales bacterium]